ncbi:MAG: hypothetical protein ACRDV6_05155, partial [Acidimicrobiales bacterium]
LEAWEKDPDLRVRLRDRIEKAAALVVERGQAAGVVRSDVDGSDVMQLLGPMCTNATLSEEQSMRLLGMILDGLRAS